MKSKKRVLASALAAASLAVSSRAQGVGGSKLLGWTVASMVGASAIGLAVFVDYLHKLFLGYKAVGKVAGVTANAKETKRNFVEEAVRELANSISVKRGDYFTRYGEAPEGFLSVSCGGQKWYVCFVKDENKGGFVALCGQSRSLLIKSVKRLVLKNVFDDKNNVLAREKYELKEQVRMFTRHIVDIFLPGSSEDFREAVWNGLYPVMLDRMWATFSEGQYHFAVNSEQASEIVKTVKYNYDSFAMFVD